MRRNFRDMGRSAMNMAGNRGNQLAGLLGQLDDSVQSFGRGAYNTVGNYADQYIPGDFGSNVRQVGEIMHRDRRNYYLDDPLQQVALVGSRAAQAGGVTAAGAGLINLGGQITSVFGGQGDTPTNGQLYM